MRKLHEKRVQDSPLLPYRSGDPLSYTSGAYATLELLRARPRRVRAVYLHPDYRDPEPLQALCRAHDIPVCTGARAFQTINRRENAYVLGVFETYRTRLAGKRPHVVLVEPADEGNLGTIARTLAALGTYDLALIAPAADIWCPKTIRASMGAVFQLYFDVFPSIEDYLNAFPHRRLYPFMLDGAHTLGTRIDPGIMRPDMGGDRTGMVDAQPGMDDTDGANPGAGRARSRAKGTPFSLVFGPESTGLPPRYHELGTAIRIPQSKQVDSLNLAAAVAIAAFTCLA